MTLGRRFRNGLKQVAGSGYTEVDFGTAATQVAQGSKLPGPIPVDTTGGAAGTVLQHDGTKYAPAAAAGLGASPFLFRLDPTSTAQFGTARSASANLPTVAAMLSASNRPFVRMTSATDSVAKFVPLLAAPGGSVLAASGHFIVHALLNWTTVLGGIGFNASPTTGVGCFAVTRRSSDITFFESYNNNTPEATQAQNEASIDASVEWVNLWLDVWLDTASGKCTYTYASQLGSLSFKQRRQASLAVAGGTAVGLWCTGNVGTMDVAELTIWKQPLAW